LSVDFGIAVVHVRNEIRADAWGIDMCVNDPGRDARFWVERLNLARHPEGGWFRETYRAAESVSAGLPERFDGPRSFSTAIYYLLEQGDYSRLHRIKSDEIWHFYAGAPLVVHMIDPLGSCSCLRLGCNPEQGELFQVVVPAGCWFGAESLGGYSLVGCTVAPGFDFRDFEMADAESLLREYSRHAALIRRLTGGEAARQL